jgi:hypothetical protein
VSPWSHEPKSNLHETSLARVTSSLPRHSDRHLSHRSVFYGETIDRFLARTKAPRKRGSEFRGRQAASFATTPGLAWQAVAGPRGGEGLWSGRGGAVEGPGRGRRWRWQGKASGRSQLIGGACRPSPAHAQSLSLSLSLSLPPDTRSRNPRR